MIIREQRDAFVMTEQNEHAEISGEIITHWKENLFIGASRRRAVEYAIAKHDLGWEKFDKQPFWNDKKQEPFTFTDFPLLPKTVLYTNGIDEVEKENLYAGLLCSVHYARFMEWENHPAADKFIDQEKQRQQRILEQMDTVNKDTFHTHFAMLQLCDSLSLYLCINEPGAGKGEEHPFFRDGIQTSSAFRSFMKENMTLTWKTPDTIAINDFPFKHPFTVTLKQKTLNKQDIADHGLIDSYENTPYEERTFHLVPEQQ